MRDRLYNTVLSFDKWLSTAKFNPARIGAVGIIIIELLVKAKLGDEYLYARGIFYVLIAIFALMLDYTKDKK
jgi:hypothetical protein